MRPNLAVVPDTATLRKARGAFFTPDAIAEFTTNWAVRTADDLVLEPSCGEAAFLTQAVRRLMELQTATSGLAVPPRVDGVEIHDASAAEADRLVRAAGGDPNIITSDFFLVEPEPKYTAVIGNPPYIRFQDFSGEARTRVPGFDEFSFEVNYWWRHELEAEDFERWMNGRIQRANRSMWSSWLDDIDMDVFDFLDDPMSSAEYAAFNTWYQAHGIFEWWRLVAEMNRSPGAGALMILELFDSEEFPDELITPYVAAGVPSAEHALTLHRDGVPLELVSAMYADKA